MPTGLFASSHTREVMLELLGEELMLVLERVGLMAGKAAAGDYDAALEMRRLRWWLGPLHWWAMCMMLNEGRLTGGHFTAPVRTFTCRDALIMAMDLENQRMRWGMP
jgi:hypothetical protein